MADAPPFEFLPAALGIQRGASWRMEVPAHRNHDHVRGEAEAGKAGSRRGHSASTTTHQPSLPAPVIRGRNSAISTGSIWTAHWLVRLLEFILIITSRDICRSPVDLRH